MDMILLWNGVIIIDLKNILSGVEITIIIVINQNMKQSIYKFLYNLFQCVLIETSKDYIMFASS